MVRRINGALGEGCGEGDKWVIHKVVQTRAHSLGRGGDGSSGGWCGGLGLLNLDRLGLGGLVQLGGLLGNGGLGLGLDGGGDGLSLGNDGGLGGGLGNGLRLGRGGLLLAVLGLEEAGEASRETTAGLEGLGGLLLNSLLGLVDRRLLGGDDGGVSLGGRGLSDGLTDVALAH